MLYQIKDGTVSAGGHTILSHIEFYIKEKEKLAVVGKNGAGKTTLLKLLAGELTLDRDDRRGNGSRRSESYVKAARITKRKISETKITETKISETMPGS